MRVALAAILVAVATSALADSEQDTKAWRESGLALVPQGYVASVNWACTHFVDMIGYLAVFPSGSNDPAGPASIFAPQQALALRLVRKDGELRAVSAKLEPRTAIGMESCDDAIADPTGVEREYQALHDALAAKRATLPPGTEPCDLGAWSEDRDSKGLNVRAEPNAASRVLGIQDQASFRRWPA